jgi:hypothetical protein
MMGTVTTIAAAAIDPVGWLNCEAPGNSAMAAGTVCAAVVEVSEKRSDRRPSQGGPHALRQRLPVRAARLT